MQAAPPTLVYCGIVPYDSIRQRPQWLADGLTRHARVLYVEPHRSILRGGARSATTERRSESLAVLTPPAALPVTGFIRPLNKVSGWRTARAIRHALHQLDWSAPAYLLATFPKHADLVPSFPTARLLYDIMDDYPRFFSAPQARVLAGMHSDLLRAATTVTASSRTLADRFGGQAQRPITVLKNAVSETFVAACASASPAAELASLPRPVFGYVGTLGRWFDFEAVRSLAQAFPQGSVVLIGPADVALPGLPSNVRWLGPRAHEELPALLKAMDAGLVPFVPSPLVEAVNPVKVYEYLAAGLVVLGTEFAELKRFGPAVCCAPPAEWPRLFSERVGAPRPQVPLGERWEARAEELWRLLTA